MKTKQLLSSISLSVLMLFGADDVCAQQREAEYVPTIIAGVRKADSWTMNNTHEGIYSLELKEGGALTCLKEGKPLAPLGGAVYVDDKMDGINYTAVEDYGGMSYVVSHVQYDMTNWANNYFHYLSDLDRNFISSCGLAHDPTSGKNYGVFFNFNLDWQVVDRKFGTIDFTEKQPSKENIAVMTTPMVTIACNASGQLYAIGQDGFLYTINKSSGNILPVGDTGISNISTYPMSMTFDPKTGKLYWNVVTTAQKAAIYEVSTATGAATKVMDTPDNAILVNMYIAAPEADDDAPAAVTNLAAHFDGEQTTGKVTFTAPTLSYLGNPITGELAYRVTANDELKAEGTVAVGADAEAEVNLNAGDNEVVVIVSNDAGDSPAASIAVFVGPEKPLAPENVMFDYDFDTKQATLTWSAPTMGTHGKEIYADDLTYIVERIDNDKTIVSGISQTTYTFDFEPGKLAAYGFRVAAINKNVAQSDFAESNKAVVGDPKAVPYRNGFNTAQAIEDFTIIDANADGKTWAWGKSLGGEGRMEYFVNSEQQADDWLLTPPVYLYEDATYELQFDALTAYVNCADYLHVAYGQGQEVTAYTDIEESILLNEPQTHHFTYDKIKPHTTGAFYFGFHAISPSQYGGMIILDNVWILLKESTNAIADVVGEQPYVKAIEGGIEICGAENNQVEIFNEAGALVAKTAGRQQMMKPLKAGLYVVRIADKTYKITVK